MDREKIVWITIAGTCVCIIISIILFGLTFGDVHKPPLYFLVLGFTGSLSLALFEQKRIRDAIYVNVLIYILFAVVASILRPVTALILLIYYLSLIVAIYTYVRYFDEKISHVAYARPLLLAAIMAVFYILSSLVHGLIFLKQFTPRFLMVNFPIGFLLGLGIGIGREIVTKLFTRRIRGSIDNV
ncbi:MAG: hypothetical protein V2J62_08490 [candidate division KSB1 bacterium]|nr:hypothetical protein [candidate division KSB1 bacterium]